MKEKSLNQKRKHPGLPVLTLLPSLDKMGLGSAQTGMENQRAEQQDLNSPLESSSPLKRSLLASKRLESKRAKVIEEKGTGLQNVNMSPLKDQRPRVTP